MKKIFIILLFLFSVSYGATIKASQTVLCCPTKDKTSEAYQIVGNKKALLNYMYRNQCTVISAGDTVERVDTSFTMIKVVNDWGEFWCPREIE